MEANSGDDAGEPTAGDGAAAPRASATVGTGSSLAIGCLAVMLVFVLIALAIRVFTPLW